MAGDAQAAMSANVGDKADTEPQEDTTIDVPDPGALNQ